MRLNRPIVLLALLAAAPSCSRHREAASKPPDTSAADPRQVVAEVDGKPITRAEVDGKATDALITLRQQEYETLRRALDDIIGERLIEKEAANRRLSRQALLKAEVEDQVPPADPAQLDAIYEQNKARFPGKTKEEMVPEIARAVRQQSVNARAQAYREELRSKAKVRVSLDPPRARVIIPADAPSLGPQKAPVTIVEFSDYQCPYCRRAQGVVEQLLDRYRGKVRFVHRDFPLDGHPRALPAAKAARCADEQGKFWDYHRGLLNAPGDFSDQDFKGRAASLGLDAGRFQTCLDSPRHEAFIRASLAEGARIGVTGTPAFFINGRMLFGARPLEQFAEVIDTELAAAP